MVLDPKASRMTLLCWKLGLIRGSFKATGRLLYPVTGSQTGFSILSQRNLKFAERVNAWKII